MTNVRKTDGCYLRLFLKRFAFVSRSLVISLSALVICLCTRAPIEHTVEFAIEPPPAARPLAIVHAGEHPLWFQFTDNGPVHIGSIEEAFNSAAFIPWPLAPHARFVYEGESEIVIAVNRDGFLKISSTGRVSEGLSLYRFGGGQFWKQYTIGALFSYGNQHVVLLYIDDFFLEQDLPVPEYGAWTFDMKSNSPFPIDIPALEIFKSQEGWEIDIMRRGAGGYWYYRALKKRVSRPEVRYLKTDDLTRPGTVISIDEFFNSFIPKEEKSFPSLPELPGGFFYTEVAAIGNSLVACWEEQRDFYIGAAGFLIILNEE